MIQSTRIFLLRVHHQGLVVVVKPIPGFCVDPVPLEKDLQIEGGLGNRVDPVPLEKDLQVENGIRNRVDPDRFAVTKIKILCIYINPCLL